MTIETKLPQSFRTMDKTEQLLLGFENEPDLKEKYKKTQFKVSILGGDEAKDDAEKLGYSLVKNWYSIATGGYNDGTMKKALEGGDRALKELRSNSANERALRWFNPAIVGITTESFRKLEPVRGEHIINNEAENPYERLKQLIEDSKVAVVLTGGNGTLLEALADLVFNKKLGANTSRPTIFVGDTWGSSGPVRKLIDKYSNVYRVNNIDEALKLVEKLFGETTKSKDRTDKKRKTRRK